MDFVTSAAAAAVDDVDAVDGAVVVVAGELGGKQAYTPDEEWWLLQPQIERRE